MNVPATGTQYEIAYGPWTAVITEQGATLRRLQFRGRDVVTTFDEDSSPAGCQGQHLLPWPNRIRDGKYSFDGVEQQLAISEPDRGTALHGLANWRCWTLIEHSESSLTQTIVLHAEPGWPGVVRTTIVHRLSEDGLTVEVTTTNVGSTPVPYGYAAHPYLVVDGPIDEWSVTMPFARYLEVDERLLPVELAGVENTVHDFRSARIFADTVLDTAFTAVTERDQQRRWQVSVTSGDQSAALWGDEQCTWLQIYTPDDRASLAVEPMTCGPDTFNEGPTHADLIRLEPGESSSLSWGITAQ